jgi:hypothetical protein
MGQSRHSSLTAVLGLLAFAGFAGTLSWQWQSQTTTETFSDATGMRVVSLNARKVPHGLCRQFNTDGTLHSETDFSHGQWTHRVLFYRDGSVWQEHFTDGRDSLFFDRDGQPIEASEAFSITP